MINERWKFFFNLTLRFVLPDLWVVGYGLDDGQTKRSWTHLFGIPKTDSSLNNKHDDIFGNQEAYQALRSNMLDQLSQLSKKLA